ncbi:MAG TPA: ATP-binding protein [Candidatus Ozemobacteraceae bacterium]|nr:ATP-binding protein [Candidatus Ozemobacteraceae bacterium]
MDQRRKARVSTRSSPRVRRSSVRLKACERRLERERRVLQARKLSAIAALAGGFAHDFNNMLAAINGFTELALDDIPADSPARENLTEVFAGVKKARHLVDQIHAIGSRNRRGFKTVSLSRLLEDRLSHLRTRFPSTVQLQTNVCSAVPTQNPDFPITANPDEIGLVIEHLVQNGFEALPASGGRITIELRYPGSGQIELSVKDTGSGIAPQVMEHLFEPFFTTRQKARGLGLAMCHGIVDKHRGSISVQSQLGHGTCVKICLPQEDAANNGSATK